MKWMHSSLTRAAAGLALVASVCAAPGCMTVQEGRPVVANQLSAQAFVGKKVAMLPVKMQSSLMPDSVTSIRTDITRKLGPAMQGALPPSTIVDVATVSDLLNQRNVLPAFEQLMQTYENAGVMDKQRVAQLGQALGADYLLVSRLRAEKLDIFIISKSTGGSLDLSLVDTRTAQVVWGGTGEWKRGGVLGFGGANSEEVAQGLVSQALASLK